VDPEVCSHWRLTPGRVLGDRVSGTWEATRDDTAFVVKYFDRVSCLFISAAGRHRVRVSLRSPVTRCASAAVERTDVGPT